MHGHTTLEDICVLGGKILGVSAHRLIVCAILRYVTLDLSLPMTPGAFVVQPRRLRRKRRKAVTTSIAWSRSAEPRTRPPSDRCACGCSGAAACGPGGLTAWERGGREGGARA